MAHRVFFLIALLAISADAHGDDGDLDVTFGDGGRVTTDFYYQDGPRAIAVQSDGKILAGGIAFAWPVGGSQDFALARYNVDGSLDQTFGSSGKVTTDISNSADQISNLWIQDDGKILAAGTAYIGISTWVLVRYNSDGSLDQSFGTSGKIIFEPLLDFSLYLPYTIAIQRDGKFLTAGIAFFRENDRGDIGLARYNGDGSLDETFGTSGKVTIDLSPSLDAPGALAVQPDGKILVGGCSESPALIRLNSDGSLDTMFGRFGLATAPACRSLLILPNRKIVVGGGAEEDVALYRYNPDGSLDTAWGGTGTVMVDLFGVTERVGGITLQSDGKVLVAGYTYLREQIQSGALITRATGSFVARFTRTGEFDPTFVAERRVELPFGVSIAIQPDGNILIAGTTVYTAQGLQNPPSDFRLIRLINSDVPRTIEVRIDPESFANGRSWTTTFLGSNLNEETYFDIRFLPPNSNTEQVALNWQRGISASHSLPPGTTAGIWRVTGVRPHQDANDHSSEFLLTAATLTVN